MDQKAYRNLAAWQRGMELVEAVYAVTIKMPEAEKFGLTSQVRRAAVSIPANIAEGYGRPYRKEYPHHVGMARGSLMEVETHLTLTVRLGMLDRESVIPAWQLCQETGRLLTTMIQSLQRPPKQRQPPNKQVDDEQPT